MTTYREDEELVHSHKYYDNTNDEVYETEMVSDAEVERLNSEESKRLVNEKIMDDLEPGQIEFLCETLWDEIKDFISPDSQYYNNNFLKMVTRSEFDKLIKIINEMDS